LKVLTADKSPAGVTWSPKFGAACPDCGCQKVSPHTTKRWEAENRVRYHRCSGCGTRFKSIETDYTIALGLIP
jgi:Zn ribbon nucleic-acid-binding protein